MSRCPAGDSSGCQAPSCVPGYCLGINWDTWVPPTSHHLWGSNLLVGTLLSQHPPSQLLRLFRWRARRLRQSQDLKQATWRFFLIEISSLVFATFSSSASNLTHGGMNMHMLSLLLQRSSSMCTAFRVKFVNEWAMEKIVYNISEIINPRGPPPQIYLWSRSKRKELFGEGQQRRLEKYLTINRISQYMWLKEYKRL